MTILVTGGTGGLGRPAVEQLRARGADVRILSRRPGPGRVVADLDRGTGLDAALDGVGTVLHLASNRRKDLPGTERLLAAATRAGVGHLIYISIVGVEDIPYFYYRDKVDNERAIAESGVPFTTLRATQFHSFPVEFIRLQRRLPATFALDVPIQPIAVEEVAARLVELAEAAPAGRVADIGGPEILRFREVAEIWHRAHGEARRVRMLRLGGKAIRAFQAGHHLTGLPGHGRETFAEYAARSAKEAGR